MRNIAQLILLMLLCGAAHAEVAIPPWNKFATDLTGTLTPAQLLALNQQLADLEADKGAQFAVLIVPTTQPEDTFQFGMRVFESWKLGRKGVDDGLLFVVARDDDKYRILTGYGMEGVLPDVKLKQLAEDILVPRLKRGEVYGGIEAFVSALIKIVQSEPLPPPTGHSPVWYASVTPQDAVPIPPWTQPVIDLTGTLDPGRLQALNKRLEAFEYRKGAQIGVLLVPTTRTENSVQFTRRVCETWQLGRDGVDDGVIMTVTQEDRQLRIEVGRGLESVLDNAKLAEIVNEIIVPNLMVGEFDAGIVDGVDAIMKVVETIPLPPPDHSLLASISRSLAQNSRQYLGEFILMAFLGIAVLYRYSRRLKAGGSVPE